MKQNKYKKNAKKCEKNNFNIFSCLNKNIEPKSKGKKLKMINKTQNGPGGACEMQWCEKENISGPAQRLCLLQPPASLNNKTRALLLNFQLLIPGFSMKTHNIKNVQHEETNPTICRT